MRPLGAERRRRKPRARYGFERGGNQERRRYEDVSRHGLHGFIAELQRQRGEAGRGKLVQSACQNVRDTWPTAGGSVGSTTYKELTSSGTGALRCEFVSWANNDLTWSLFGTMINTTTGGASTGTLAGDFDGAGTSGTPEVENVQWTGGPSASALQLPLSLTGSASPNEGKHYITTFGMSTAGTVTVSGTGGGEEVRHPAIAALS